MAETMQMLQRKSEMLPAPIISLIQGLLPDCTTLLPVDISTDQFRAGLWLELVGRPGLAECYPASLRDCIVKASTYGMLPGRDCHFLPFNEKGRQGKKATFVPNYFGVLRSLYRTGMVDRAFAEVVFTNDTYDLDYGRTPMLIHKPPRKNRGVGEGAYGFIQLKGSSQPLIHYMDPDDLDRVRRKAPAHEQGPWVSDSNEMKRKTAMKNAAKYAQLTPMVQQFLAEEDVRQDTDIPPERHRKNIKDLFDNNESASTPGASGDVVDVESDEDSAATETPVGASRPAGDRALSYVAQIEALLVTEGSPILAFWRWATVQKKKAQAQFSEADYADLLARVQSQAQKNRQSEAAQDAQKTDETRANFGPDAKTDPSHTETKLGPSGSLPGEYVTIDSYTGEVLDPHDSAALDRDLAAQERQPGEEG